MFRGHNVSCPETHLIPDRNEAEAFLKNRTDISWCLKYPIGCGASGHRCLDHQTKLPEDWPRPYIIQEFVHLKVPGVFRLYGAGGNLFGWVARKFPPSIPPSPWVAHARGARYEPAGEAPPKALEIAHQALELAGLLNSFGCVDLIKRDSGEWLVLEIGTDGQFNHVDRQLSLEAMEQEIDHRVAKSFQTWAESAFGNR